MKPKRPTILDLIFEKQAKFNANFFDPSKLSFEERQQFTKDFVLHMNDECHEVLRCVNWKMHRPMTEVVNKEDILEECVDVFKFLLGVLQVWDFTAEEFADMFFDKSKKVEEKFENARDRV